MDEIIGADSMCIFGEDSKPIRPLITKVEYTFDEFQARYAPFCGDARVHVEPVFLAGAAVERAKLCFLKCALTLPLPRAARPLPSSAAREFH